MRSRAKACFFVAVLILPQFASAEWSAWRGNHRNGMANAGAALRTDLPQGGLAPRWVNEAAFGGGGGWASPIAADGRVFQYSHVQTKRDDVDLPPPEFPPLTDEQKQKLSPAEQEQYENNRSEERQQRRAKQFRFSDEIVCLDAATGEQIWRHQRSSEPTRWRQSSTPAIDGQRLCYIGADRRVVCLNVADGSQHWAAPIPFDGEKEESDDQPISSSPLVVDGRVVVLAERLIAFDLQDGSVLWKGAASQDGANYSSPALWRSERGNRIVANIGKAGTVCVDAADGRERWRVESMAGRSSPVVVGDALLTYGSSRKGGLRRYQMTDEQAELKWKSHRFADQGSSPVVVGGRVFVQGDRYFGCIDFEDGDTIWRTTLDLEKPRYTSPIAADDQVFYTFGGVLCVPADKDEYEPHYDARIGESGLLASESYFREKLNIDSLSRTAEGQQKAEQLWRQRVESTGPRRCVSPAFSDGRLYIRLNRGLACFDLGAN